MKKLLIICLVLMASQAYGQTPGTVKWEFMYPISRGPAIAKDGTIYGVGHASITDYLYAINPDGTLKWEYSSADLHSFNSNICIGEDNSVYIFTYPNKLTAINPDGTKKWELSSDWIPKAIGADGTIYVRDDYTFLHALNPEDGSEKWMYDNVKSINHVLIGIDGIIFIQGDNYLKAIYPYGLKKWSMGIPGVEIWYAAIGIDGSIYLGTVTFSEDQKQFFAINPWDGSIKWVFIVIDDRFDSHIFYSPVIGLDGTIYVGASDNKLYAINPDGTPKWECKVDGIIKTALLVGDNGIIYAVPEDMGLHAITPGGSIKWIGYGSQNINMGPDGTLYYSNKAIYSDSTGLADSSWPMYQHDAQHTGRVSVPVIPVLNRFFILVLVLMMGLIFCVSQISNNTVCVSYL